MVIGYHEPSKAQAAIALAARIAAAAHDPELDVGYDGALANVAEYLDEAVEAGGGGDALRAALSLAVAALGALARCPGLEGVDAVDLAAAHRPGADRIPIA